MILMDIDGVLADFSHSYRLLAKEMFNPNLEIFPVGQRPFTTWGDPDITPEQDTAIFDRITNDEIEASKFWNNLRPLVDIKTWNRLDILSREGKIYFVSNRWGKYAQKVTTSWLRYRGVECPTVILSSRKSLVALAVKAKWALDDKWENVWDMKPYCHACLITRPYNINYRDPSEKVGRVDTVDAFLDMVESGYEPRNIY